MRVTFVGSGDAFGSGGRTHTCIRLEADHLDWLVDCGATAPLAIARMGIDPNGIDTILVTHFHGDHFGGVPFFVLGCQFKTRRETPLTIAGPPGIEAAYRALADTLYPGLASTKLPFRLDFREIAPGETIPLGPARVRAHAMRHDARLAHCLGYRIEAGGRVFAYSGDTSWCDEIPALAEGADLFVVECYVRSRKMAIHLDHATLTARLPEIHAKRVMLTHMGDDMLAHLAEIPQETAADGLTLTL